MVHGSSSPGVSGLGSRVKVEYSKGLTSRLRALGFRGLCLKRRNSSGLSSLEYKVHINQTWVPESLTVIVIALHPKPWFSN